MITQAIGQTRPATGGFGFENVSPVNAAPNVNTGINTIPADSLGGSWTTPATFGGLTPEAFTGFGPGAINGLTGFTGFDAAPFGFNPVADSLTGLNGRLPFAGINRPFNAAPTMLSGFGGEALFGQPFFDRAFGGVSNPVNAFGTPNAFFGGSSPMVNNGLGIDPFFGRTNPAAGVSTNWLGVNNVQPRGGWGAPGLTPTGFETGFSARPFGFTQGAPTSSHSAPISGANIPAVDLWEDQNNLYLEVETPGVPMDDMDVLLSAGGELTIRAARRTGRQESDRRLLHRERTPFGFCRVIRLPVAIDESKVQTAVHDGVLTLTLPKKVAATENAQHVRVTRLTA